MWCTKRGAKLLAIADVSMRRGLWYRISTGTFLEPRHIELFSGREGDDGEVSIMAGDVMTPEKMRALAEVLEIFDAQAMHHRDVKASARGGESYAVDLPCGERVWPLSREVARSVAAEASEELGVKVAAIKVTRKGRK